MNELLFLKSAQAFHEALVLGNGRLGAIAYGGVDEDVYALNEDTLWSGYPRDLNNHCAEEFRHVRELVLAGDVKAAEAWAAEHVCGYWGQCYLPAGRLVIKGDFGEVGGYRRTLSLDNALHTVQFDDCLREAFVSHPDDLLCIRYQSQKSLPVLEISLDGLLRPSVYIEGDLLMLEGEAPGDGIPEYINVDEHYIYSDEPSKRGMRYGIGLRVRTDGSVTADKGAFAVRGASWMEVYLTAKTSFAGYDRHPYLDGIDYKGEILQILDTAQTMPYDELKRRHVEDYRTLFGRVQLTLEGGNEELPIDERLLAHTTVQPDVSLYALMYQYGRYLLISSSRPGTQATNLQGIWNVSPTAPWSCNYTVNINTQMNYWGACGANLAECCEPLHSLIYELAEAGQRTAREVFGADGFCVNHNVDLWRCTHPVGEWNKVAGVRFGYFPLAGAWLTRHLYEYFLATNDLAFLGGKAFDAIMGSARFCDSMLIEHDKKLIFCPATSPENSYLVDGKEISLAKYSAMYQSIVRDAFEICIAACRTLDREHEWAQHLEARLTMIPWIEMLPDGRIAEWDGEKTETDIEHRHLSHLYSFYPAKKVTDPALIAACKRSLAVRGDDSAGWSSAWKICLWAGLGDGERALALCNQLVRYTVSEGSGWHGGTHPNLLCTCPPFQIDANFGFVAAVNEMLVQERNGEVILLPALPALWKNGKVKGLRVGGKTVNIEWRDGKITSADVIPESI